MPSAYRGGSVLADRHLDANYCVSARHRAQRGAAGDGLSLEDILELEHEALAEIGNIILNACIATVANLLQRSLTMSLPGIVRGTSDGRFDLSVSLAEDVVLFVHTNFSLKGRQVVGYVAMIMDFASLGSLKQLVADVIRRMAG